MRRVVLDHLVLLRGLLNPHSICGRLLSEYAHRYKAVFSNSTVKVYFLLYHPDLVAKYPRLSKVDPKQAGRLFARAQRVHIEAAQHKNAFIAAAIAAQADYLVCEDASLLALQGKIEIPIIDTRAFIALLETESK